MADSAAKDPERIYILGTGGVGKLVAHAIRGISDPPPVTILFHRPSYYEEFYKEKNSISIKTGPNTEVREGFDAEIVLASRTTPERTGNPARFQDAQAANHTEPISNLIVSVKAHQTVSALKSVAHRLGPDSTVLFLQNGMGVADEVNEKIFPDEEKRPTYMLGVNSHGITSTGVCSAIHAGHGTFLLGILPRKSDPSEEGFWNPGSKYLLRTLTRIPVLGAVGLTPTDLVQAQLEKLVVNCVINPLTVVFDNRNGSLLNNFAIARVMNLLIAEISSVIRSLPELQGVPNVDVRFGPERLKIAVLAVAEKTGENISSMLQDMRRGAETEIEYINGYIVRRGEELGIKPVMNYMLMQMVIGKVKMVSDEVYNYTPMAKEAL